MGISPRDVKHLAVKYGIDTSVVSLATLKKGIDTEMEHRDLIGTDPEKALKIALAHLRETPRYYKQLALLERREERYWKDKVKPSIFKQ